MVTLGETMGLVYPSEVGPLHHVSHLRLSVAGSESNVAIGVRRLGGVATWIGRVGVDEIGDLVLRDLRAENVTTRVCRDEAASTGLMLKTRRSDDITMVAYYRAASAGSRLCPDDLDEEAIRAAGILHITGITPALGERPAAAVRAAIATARAVGVPVSMDLNYRAALWDPATAAATSHDLIKDCDLVFVGEQEAALLVDADTPSGLATALADLGPQQSVLKRGHHGCIALIDDALHEQPALAVRAVDPVGAGDAFVAGYLADYLTGQPPAQRLVTAVTAGAFAVTVPGDWEGLP